jgi:hypothetical protein
MGIVGLHRKLKYHLAITIAGGVSLSLLLYYGNKLSLRGG